ncbi:TetR/AcrR family transcriptional regulator [Nocardia sp. 004]|uniref:TetR/AcrR family transcriptional regulator n=1 Tax=Nocardia sp. 004 TaxID=3385978 RepID=UPI0039A03333
MSPKRELVLDAAIDLLGSSGIRALTHRAVDAAAGMPVGSASNYFRTREALLIGIAERLSARDYADWEVFNRQPAPRTIDELIEGIAAFVVYAARIDRIRTLARYVLFLEAQTTPALQESVQQGHLLLTELVGTLLVSAGGDQGAAQILVDQFDGIILHQVMNPTTGFDPRPALDRLVRALINGTAH